MKNFVKTVSSILVFIALLSLTISPVAAKTKGDVPDPTYKTAGIYIERSHLPYYGANAVVDQYLLQGKYYSEDVVSHQIVGIELQEASYSIEPTFSVKELKGQAQKLIVGLFGNKINTSSLSFSLGKKVGTFFFRWEDASKQLDDGTPVFIQVGLSHNGDFLNLVNTIPFGHNASDSPKSVSSDSVSPEIGPFNQIYANGGSRWKLFGSYYFSATGGWYYLHPAGCSGTFCSKFYWSYMSSCPTCYIKGTWTPNVNTKTKAAAFIPNKLATAIVGYIIDKGDGSTYVKSVNQALYFNSWASLTPNTSEKGILRIKLENFDPPNSRKYIAYDEIWVYNP